jgi:iron complex outermembrane receptor protein
MTPRIPLTAAVLFLAGAASAADKPMMVASADTRSFGQYLVDRAVEKHPELIGLDLNATPPNGREPVVIASKSPERVGRKAEPVSKPAAQVDPATGKTIEVAVPLEDRSGKTIGSMRAVYAYDGDDQSRFVTQAEAIGGEMRRQIPTVAQLVQPARFVPTDALTPGTIELPTTKQVVGRSDLEQVSQDGYAEAVKHVAGVAPANSKGSANDSIYIRGIKLNLFSNYRINGGLPIAGVITVPNEDKDRIEALKGANALMFGVASPAGIMNLITKRATSDVTSVSVAGNGFGQYGGAFDVARRFGSDDQVGVRLNGSATQLQNGVRGLDGDGEFVGSGLDWRASDRLTLSGDFEYYRKRVPEQAGISLLDPVNGKIPITPVPDPRNLLSGPWAMYTPETTNAQVRSDYQLSDNVKLSAELGRSYSDRSRFTTRIGGYDLETGAGGQVRVSTVTQNYRNSFGRIESLSTFSTSIFSHELTFGGSITDRRAETPLNRKEVLLKQTQNIFDPLPLTAPIFAGQPGSLPLQISRDGGVYAYDSITVTQNLPRLLLGMRYTEDYENNGKLRNPVSCPECGPNTSWIFLPSAGVLWDVVPRLTLFASYMQGLEAGATAPANAANANEILPAAVSTQKEVGIRTAQLGWLRGSISIFEIDKANPVTDPTPRPECNNQPMCFINSGQINYKGLEATASVDVHRRVTVDAGWQWLRAVQVTPDPKFNGLVPENTPSALANVRVTYRIPYIDGLSIHGGASGVTQRYVNFQQQGVIPGYVLYSAGAQWIAQKSNPRLALQLNVENLTNLRYWNSVQTGTYGIGMDRTVRMQMKIDY